MEKIYCLVCGTTFYKSHNVPNLELDFKAADLKRLKPGIVKKIKSKRRPIKC